MSMLVQQFYQVTIKIIGQCINYTNCLSSEDDYGLYIGKDFKGNSLRTQEKSRLRFESRTLINY